MLSIFPNFFTYSLLVPTALRLFLGLFLLKAAWSNYQLVRQAMKPQKALFWSVLKLIGAVLILSGFLLQPTAIVFALLTLNLIIMRNKIPVAQKYPVEFYILLIIAYLSLVVLGPGLYAIDLPL
jgi:uncharacterized membrane protein YphA (DoxX/SURF4 family)